MVATCRRKCRRVPALRETELVARPDAGPPRNQQHNTVRKDCAMRRGALVSAPPKALCDLAVTLLVLLAAAARARIIAADLRHIVRANGRRRLRRGAVAHRVADHRGSCGLR